jgi:hypothetical protein
MDDQQDRSWSYRTDGDPALLSPMRVVLDTNILVSALIAPAGNPAAIYNAWETSALILGSSSRPVRPMADWNHELGDWLRGALKLWIQQYRGARQICTPNLGIC